MHVSCTINAKHLCYHAYGFISILISRGELKCKRLCIHKFSSHTFYVQWQKASALPGSTVYVWLTFYQCIIVLCYAYAKILNMVCQWKTCENTCELNIIRGVYVNSIQLKSSFEIFIDHYCRVGFIAPMQNTMDSLLWNNTFKSANDIFNIWMPQNGFNVCNRLSTLVHHTHTMSFTRSFTLAIL